MRRNAAAQIDPLDFPERVVRQNGRELQGLIEGGRDTGGFEVIKSKCHERSLARGAESVISQRGSACDAQTAIIPPHLFI